MPDDRRKAERPFDPRAIIHVLNEHEVEYIVIGGYAAGVQGATWVTTDLDVTYARDRQNLRRLAEALKALEAVPAELPLGVRVTLDARALGAGDVWTLDTLHGRLDLLGQPAAGLAYATLLARARPFQGQDPYRVASIDDLIAMKRAAGRPKDVGHVEMLEMVSAELKRRADRPR